MDQDSSQTAVTLRRLVNGYQTTQAIHVAAKLGIADLLADGPRMSDDLAVATATHAPSLYRLMRALAAVDILREEDGVLFDQPHVVSGAPALLVVERQLGPANDQPEAKFSDLNMLVSPGGRERTTDEYEAAQRQWAKDKRQRARGSEDRNV